MANQNAAELLIRIGADPSNAENNIQQFRSKFSQSVSGMSGELAQWSAQSSASFSNVERTAQTLSDHFKTDVGAVSAILDRNRQTAQLWKTQLVANLTEVLNTSQNLSVSLDRSFLQFDSALGANIANAIVWQKSIGEAFNKAALQAISSIAQESLVRAVYSSALGFYLLAVQDYGGAAAAFEAAAIYGAVGGAASLAGRAIASSGAAASGSSGGGHAQDSGSNSNRALEQPSVSGPPAPQHSVQVIFQGPVYGGQAGIDELVSHISQAVVERDVNLVAYTVVRQPTTRA